MSKSEGKLYDALAERVWAVIVASGAFKAAVRAIVAEYLAEPKLPPPA